MTLASGDVGPTARVGDRREQDLLAVLRDTLGYARRRGYAGPDYADGMSSKLLEALPVDSKWLNLLVQESVKRAPVNLRPLLLVETRRNYKGSALFAMANLNVRTLRAHRDPSAILEADGVDYRAEARSLVEWLLDNRSRGYAGFCGGHNHEIQHLDGRGVPNDPDVVSTSYAVKALLEAATFDPSYADVARSAADFVVEDLNYREVDDGARIDYHMNHPEGRYTLNAGALGARLFLDLHDWFGDAAFERRARAILDHVASKQATDGGWTYRLPASSSHLSKDNHHNGFIIECFQRYHGVTGSARYEETVDRALSFYRDVLFEPDGAPNFDERNAYPRDIHASSQGILVFTYAGEFDLARRILEWTLDNLYAGGGRFYFRKHRFHTKRVTLMRWCQAWMAYAISEHLLAAPATDRAPRAAPRIGEGPGGVSGTPHTGTPSR